MSEGPWIAAGWLSAFAGFNGALFVSFRKRTRSERRFLKENASAQQEWYAAEVAVRPLVAAGDAKADKDGRISLKHGRSRSRADPVLAALAAGLPDQNPELWVIVWLAVWAVLASLAGLWPPESSRPWPRFTRRCRVAVSQALADETIETGFRVSRAVLSAPGRREEKCGAGRGGPSRSSRSSKGPGDVDDDIGGGDGGDFGGGD